MIAPTITSPAIVTSNGWVTFTGANEAPVDCGEMGGAIGIIRSSPTASSLAA